MSPLIYPQSVSVEGNPACHGLADLRLVLNTNSSDDIHVVVTAGQLAGLHRAIGTKLDGLNLVSLEDK